MNILYTPESRTRWRPVVKPAHLQRMYLGIAFASFVCIHTDFYVIDCSNMVGVMCLVDFCFVKKKDMLLHHASVLAVLHYMNTHPDITYKKEIAVTLLSAETSTIFLTLNNLIEKASLVKTVNQVAFVSTFVYYRIYNYSLLMLDPNIHNAFLVYSRNAWDYGEFYFGFYSLFCLNLYWCFLIFKKVVEQRYKTLR